MRKEEPLRGSHSRTVASNPPLACSRPSADGATPVRRRRSPAMCGHQPPTRHVRQPHRPVQAAAGHQPPIRAQCQGIDRAVAVAGAPTHVRSGSRPIWPNCKRGLAITSLQQALQSSQLQLPAGTLVSNSRMPRVLSGLVCNPRQLCVSATLSFARHHQPYGGRCRRSYQVVPPRSATGTFANYSRQRRWRKAATWPERPYAPVDRKAESLRDQGPWVGPPGD